jgi:CRP/FNR family cyclic AMP-dependent transcriptional regulator
MSEEVIDLSRLFANEWEVVFLRPGEVLFREGESGTIMYVVRSGRIRLSVAGHPLVEIGPGEILGEMALIDHGPRSATAEAIEASELVALDQQRFLVLVRETPMFSLALLKMVAKRLRTMNRLL